MGVIENKNIDTNNSILPMKELSLTSDSKKPGQTAVLYHYCGLSKFFLKQTLGCQNSNGGIIRLLYFIKRHGAELKKLWHLFRIYIFLNQLITKNVPKKST